MLRRVPLTLVDMEFHQCYYTEHEFYGKEDIEARFNEAVMLNQPLISDPSRGPVICLDEWTSGKAPTDPIKYFLLQVIQIMPLKVEGIAMANGLVLHELVVKPWGCRSDDYLGFWAKGRYHLSHCKAMNLYLLLDKAVTLSVLHLYKKGHLALVADLELLDDLLFHSERLEKLVHHFVNFYDHTVYLGLTQQQSKQNQKDQDKARRIQIRVFQEVDFCFASLGSQSADPRLANTNLFLTEDLEAIFLQERLQEPAEEQ
jgi:hypothetical protein